MQIYFYFEISQSEKYGQNVDKMWTIEQILLNKRDFIDFFSTKGLVHILLVCIAGSMFLFLFRAKPYFLSKMERKNQIFGITYSGSDLTEAFRQMIHLYHTNPIFQTRTDNLNEISRSGRRDIFFIPG